MSDLVNSCWLSLKSLLNYEMDSKLLLLLICLGSPRTLRLLGMSPLEEIRDRFSFCYYLKGPGERGWPVPGAPPEMGRGHSPPLSRRYRDRNRPPGSGHSTTSEPPGPGLPAGCCQPEQTTGGSTLSGSSTQRASIPATTRGGLSCILTWDLPTSKKIDWCSSARTSTKPANQATLAGETSKRYVHRPILQTPVGASLADNHRHDGSGQRPGRGAPATRRTGWPSDPIPPLGTGSATS